MEHLPPVGWAAVATKRDLDKLAETIRREIGQLEERVTTGILAAVRADLLTQTRTMIFALVSSLVTMAGLLVGLRLL